MKLLLVSLIATGSTLATDLVSVRAVPAQVELAGAAASQQFLAIAQYADGTERDVTGDVEWVASNPALVKFMSPGRLGPIANGELTLSARLSGKHAESKVTIRDASVVQPITFRREISGILTKRGCNSAQCHGGVKGQGGLKLSANALYPKDDYEWITKGGAYQVLTAEVKGQRIPRIDPTVPEKSLLLRKPSGAMPHGGGKRFEADSEDYKTILSWIRNGAPYRSGNATEEAKVSKLEVFPQVAILPAKGEHRLLITATFTDGHHEDYTHQSLYSVTNGDIVSVSPGGLVSAKQLGETSVLVRAAGQVASAGVGVIGPVLASYPKIEGRNYIDEYILGKLRRFQIVPSDLSDDSEFLRRVCLDLTGTLPPPDGVRDFLEDKDARKREKVVDALIGSPEFIDYWTFRFAELFRVSIFANGLSPKWMAEYWEWIRNNIQTNRPYDEVARERISVEGYKPPSRHFLPYNQVGTPADAMAEEVRVFMGRRLDCAQCHNHPYENWSQDQFWGMAAFFSRVFRMGQVVVDHPTNMDLGTKDVGGSMDLLHPRTKAVVRPALLDNAPLPSSPDSNPRQELARWMTSHPYFAEATVNRIWGYFFARGIVDPVDDFRSTNPATHPELLAALAADFREHGYDLRRLMKTIVSSRTYQVAHRANDTNREDVTNYSRSLSRGLDAEVLLDAVSTVTGIAETFSTAINEGSIVGQAPAGTRAIQLRDPDTFFSRFLELYGRSNRGAVPERNNKPNLSQAMHVLAGSTYVDRLSQPNSRLAKLIQAGASDENIFDEFYLAALSRHPTAGETQELKAILSKRGDREAGLREFVWALISSREFAENH